MPSKLSGATSISRILLSFSHAARCLASRPFRHRKKPRSELAHKTSRLLLQAERMRLQITRHNVSLSPSCETQYMAEWGGRCDASRFGELIERRVDWECKRAIS